MLNSFLNLIFDHEIKTGQDKGAAEEVILKSSLIWLTVFAAVYFLSLFLFTVFYNHPVAL